MLEYLTWQTKQKQEQKIVSKYLKTDKQNIKKNWRKTKKKQSDDTDDANNKIIFSLVVFCNYILK